MTASCTRMVKCSGDILGESHRQADCRALPLAMRPTSTMEAVHLRPVWPDVARQLTIAMEATGMEAGRFAGLAQILRSAR